MTPTTMPHAEEPHAYNEPQRRTISPADPSHSKQWEQATAPTRDTTLCAAGLRSRHDDPPPRLQTATTPRRNSGVQSSSAGTTT